jgi:hypothetical protein
MALDFKRNKENLATTLNRRPISNLHMELGSGLDSKADFAQQRWIQKVVCTTRIHQDADVMLQKRAQQPHGFDTQGARYGIQRDLGFFAFGHIKFGNRFHHLIGVVINII